MKYVKKPEVIDACQFHMGEDMPGWFVARVMSGEIVAHVDNSCDVKTQEGPVVAADGDYIVLDPDGRLRICRREQFEKNYEVAR